jgi:ribonuclease T2
VRVVEIEINVFAQKREVTCNVQKLLSKIARLSFNSLIFNGSNEVKYEKVSKGMHVANFIKRVICVVWLLIISTPLHASEKVAGLFEAQRTCEATQKLNSGNPGNITLEVGEIYDLLALNSSEPSHFLIEIPNATDVTKRWVGVECGDVALDDANRVLVLKPLSEEERNIAKARDQKKTDKKANAKPLQGVERDSIENLMAASWLLTFCLSNAGGRAKECKNLSNRDVYASQFSIHGLWPNDLDDDAIYPCYCHLNKPLKCNERRKPFASIDLPADLRNALQSKMPGIQSGFLHRHEWTKHGTCYEKYNSSENSGADETEYYRDSILILDQLNASKVGQLFKNNIGKVLSDNQIYSAFDQSFGKGASDKVFIDCKRVRGEWMISELFIGLGGEIEEGSKLSDLIAASPSRDVYSGKSSCRRGKVTQVR